MPLDSPVAWAVAAHRAAAVQLLARRGYRLHPSQEGLAMCLAAQQGTPGVLEALLESGASPAARHHGYTPLHKACIGQPWDERQRDPLLDGKDGPSQERQLHIIRRLVATGADLEERDPEGRTPLLVCADRAQAQAARLLQGLGADIHATSLEGKGMLEEAWAAGCLGLVVSMISSGCTWQQGVVLEEWEVALQPYSKTLRGVMDLHTHLLLLAHSLHDAVQRDEQAQAAACRRLLQLLQPACSPSNAGWYAADLPHPAERTRVLTTTWQMVANPQQLQQLMQLWPELYVPHPSTKRVHADKEQQRLQQQQRAEDPAALLQLQCGRLPEYLLAPFTVNASAWGVYHPVTFPNPTLLHVLLMLGANASHAILDAEGIGGFTPLAFCMPAWYMDRPGPTRFDTLPYVVSEVLPLVELLMAYGASVAEPVQGKYVLDVVKPPRNPPANTVLGAALRYKDPQLLTALLEGAGPPSRQFVVERLDKAASEGDAATLRLVLGLRLPWLAQHARQLLAAGMGDLQHPQALKASLKWLVQLGGQEQLLASKFAELSVETDHRAGPEGTRQIAAAQVFLDAGVDINTTQWQGCTPLLIAVMFGHPFYARWLLDHGADASAVTPAGEGLWDLAAGEGLDMVVALLGRGFALPEGGVAHLVQLLQAKGVGGKQLVHAERQLQQAIKAYEKRVQKRQKRREAPKAPAVAPTRPPKDPVAAAEAAAAALLAAEEAEAAAKAAKQAAKKAAAKKQQSQQQQDAGGTGLLAQQDDINGPDAAAAAAATAAAANGALSPADVAPSAASAELSGADMVPPYTARSEPAAGSSSHGSSSSGGGGGSGSSSSRQAASVPQRDDDPHPRVSAAAAAAADDPTVAAHSRSSTGRGTQRRGQPSSQDHTLQDPPLDGRTAQMGLAGVVACSSNTSSRVQPPTNTTSNNVNGGISSSIQRSSSGRAGSSMPSAAASESAAGQRHLPPSNAAAPGSAAGAVAAGSQAATPVAPSWGPPHFGTATVAAAAASQGARGGPSHQVSAPPSAAAAAAAGTGPPATQPSVGVQQQVCLFGSLPQGAMGRATRIKECVVCLDARSCVLTLPCLHIVMCEGCSQVLMARGQVECPLDRSTVAARIVLPCK